MRQGTPKGRRSIRPPPRDSKRTRLQFNRHSPSPLLQVGVQRGSLANAGSADGDWTFKRSGFWNPRVTARVAGSDTDIAVFRPRWMGGGTLELPDGRAKEPLIRFKGRHRLMKAKGQVEAAPEAATGRTWLSRAPRPALLFEAQWT
jgi:hypothetical protein